MFPALCSSVFGCASQEVGVSTPLIRSVQARLIQFKFKGTPTFHGMGGMAWVVAQTYPIKIAIHASRRGLRDHVNLPNATLFDSYVEYVERPPSKAPVFHHGNIQSCRHTMIHLGHDKLQTYAQITGARSTPLHNNQPGLYRN